LFIAIEVGADIPGGAVQTFVDCVIHPGIRTDDEFQLVASRIRKPVLYLAPELLLI
jgi:hypothetical protein